MAPRAGAQRRAAFHRRACRPGGAGARRERRGLSAPRLPLVVVGAGVSGLAAAVMAARNGSSPVVLEAAAEPGGRLRTRTIGAGSLWDAGAGSLMLGDPAVEAFLEEEGLAAQIVEPPAASRQRWIATAHGLAAVPLSPAALLTTPLVSRGDKLRLLGEPWSSASEPDGEETIAAFVRRRLGTSVLDTLVAPFVSGIYAGDPERLVTRWAFPKLWQLERDHGSLLRGALTLRRSRAPRRRLVSFRGGMQALAHGLAARLRARAGHAALRLGHAVEHVRPLEGGGFSIEGTAANGGGFTLDADRVWVALPADRIAGPLAPLGAAESRRIAAMPHADVATIASLYPASAFPVLPRGFGVLVPRGLGLRLLGVLFTSAMWPDRAAEGEVALTSFAGGRTDPEALALDDAELGALVQREHAQLLGAVAPPRALAIERWQPAIPQMEAGHGEILAAAAALEQRHPGLRLLGNYLEGVSVADCLRRALVPAPR